MRTVIDPYAICLAYLEDSKGSLQESDYAFLLGSIRSRAYKNLVNPFRDVGREYRSAAECRVLSQVSAFFSKNDTFANEERCLASAKLAFLKSETLCRITNKRLLHFFRYPDRAPDIVKHHLRDIRKIVSNVLGDFDSFLENIPEYISITSGATEETTRKRSRPYMKIRKRVSCTRGAMPYVDALYKFYTGTSATFRQVNCNRIVTVPKNSDTFRSIACEPAGNLPVQLAFDCFAKRRLKKFGINLSDQKHNQRLACQGSIDGSVCTIDLSMASDTLSLELVPYLFDEKWTRFFLDCRSPYYKGVFGSGKYSKLSSMGNGFTFALETLVFYAIAKSLRPNTLAVYGDDIITDAVLYDDTCALLAYFGFTPNAKKSYHKGPFRESCGADFFNGSNIRPFFIRKTECTAPELCHIINGLVSVGDVGGSLWRLCRDLVSRYNLPLVPFNDSTLSGVFVHPHDAYELGLIKLDKRGFLTFKGFQLSERTRPVKDGRGLIVWFLLVYGKSQRDAVSCSMVPVGDLRYRRRTLIWSDPYEAAPLSCYSWGTFLAA